jgi:periplasmic divalent cation tolerance protein
MKNSLILVYVTCPPVDAERVAEILVNDKLAACVNIVPVKSVYNWEGKLNRDDEAMLIIKSKSAVYPDLEAKILAIHPYDVPEIAAVKAEAVQADYLNWVNEQTK